MIPMYEYYGQQYVDNARIKLGEKIDAKKEQLGDKAGRFATRAGEFAERNVHSIAHGIRNPLIQKWGAQVGKAGLGVAKVGTKVGAGVISKLSPYLSKGVKAINTAVRGG